MSSPSTRTPRADGRTARRERNVAAALDAVHDLVVESHTLPSMGTVASRAGVSPRSLYRYFSGERELHLAALARRLQVADPYYRLDRLGEGTLDERIVAVVELHLNLYDEAADTIRAGLALAESMPLVREQVERRRRQLGAQVEAQFRPELEQRSDHDTEVVLACIEVLCQFESVDLLRASRGLSRESTREVLVVGLRALLSPDGPTG